MTQKKLDIETLAGQAGAIALERGREIHEAQQIRDIVLKAAERTAET